MSKEELDEEADVALRLEILQVESLSLVEIEQRKFMGTENLKDYSEDGEKTETYHIEGIV
ncbi:uncharacterized protein N7483_007161 [Penicillium malachiteum]|uniref:uncharacterized protein n=1 Tax=Penicillium malachiteum TaxID=1324776 RepID=UPI0025499927|nr:uncharacterized protein N7483_007161 [Penicillium malachiteum]KAJ5725804.1 hypothetical protein N7483_007161 [Penicillium malachiteum]